MTQRDPEAGDQDVEAEQSSQGYRDARATAGVAEVSASTQSASIETVTHLWLIWADIALDHARVARRAREAALRVSDTGEVSHWMRQEFDSSLVAVSASAHALDALYGSTAVDQSLRNTWAALDTNRHGKILETLKLLFQAGPVQQDWANEFKWLFKLRDAAAHAGEKPQQTVPHPLGTNTAPPFVDYSTESATRACEFLLAVLRRCVDYPKPAQPTAVQWAATHEPDIVDLERRWSQT